MLEVCEDERSLVFFMIVWRGKLMRLSPFLVLRTEFIKARALFVRFLFLRVRFFILVRFWKLRAEFLYFTRGVFDKLIYVYPFSCFRVHKLIKLGSVINLS